MWFADMKELHASIFIITFTFLFCTYFSVWMYVVSDQGRDRYQYPPCFALERG
jgi:hypothetical protein